MRATRIVTATLALLGLSTAAFARGRTFNIKNVLRSGTVRVSGPEKITIRAPNTTKLSRALGGNLPAFAPVTEVKRNRAGTALLYKIGEGRYYANPQNKTFNVVKFMKEEDR